MKNYFFTLVAVLITVVFVLPGFEAQASHYLGGAITYEHVSGNTYDFKVVIYSDCSSSLNVAFDLHFSSQSCAMQDFIFLTTTTALFDMPTWCDPMESVCLGGPTYSVSKTVMEGTYTFPANCQDWVISWSDNSREDAFQGSAIATNVVYASAASLYLETTLNNSDVADNTSVQFPVDPVVFVQDGVPVTLPTDFTEPDGDVVQFSFLQPTTYNKHKQ